MDAKTREQWVSAAEHALANNASTFAVLALDEVVLPFGLVAALEAKGYTVEISARLGQDDPPENPFDAMLIGATVRDLLDPKNADVA